MDLYLEAYPLMEAETESRRYTWRRIPSRSQGETPAAQTFTQSREQDVRPFKESARRAVRWDDDEN